MYKSNRPSSTTESQILDLQTNSSQLQDKSAHPSVRKRMAIATAHTCVAGSCNQRCNDGDGDYDDDDDDYDATHHTMLKLERPANSRPRREAYPSSPKPADCWRTKRPSPRRSHRGLQEADSTATVRRIRWLRASCMRSSTCPSLPRCVSVAHAPRRTR